MEKSGSKQPVPLVKSFDVVGTIDKTIHDVAIVESKNGYATGHNNNNGYKIKIHCAWVGAGKYENIIWDLAAVSKWQLFLAGGQDLEASNSLSLLESERGEDLKEKKLEKSIS